MPRDPRVEKFLELMRSVESDDNPNVQHGEIDYGLHKGHRAIGQEALMPNTVKEIANRIRLRGDASPVESEILSATPEEITEKLKNNPELMDKYSKELGQHVLSKQNFDPEASAVAWRWGHNLSPEKAGKIAEENPQYMERVRERLGKVGGFEEPEVDIQKLITPSIDPNDQPEEFIAPQSPKFNKLKNSLIRKP